MKKSIDIVTQLTKYFGARVIGSQLFVDAGLLSNEDTGDIDVAITTLNTPIMSFLEDAGFTSKEITSNEGYNESVIRIEYSHPEYDKTIDLNVFKGDIVTVYSIPELVSRKFQLGRTGDLKQLSMVIFNAGKNPLKSYRELQEFYNQNYKEDESE